MFWWVRVPSGVDTVENQNVIFYSSVLSVFVLLIQTFIFLGVVSTSVAHRFRVLHYAYI